MPVPSHYVVDDDGNPVPETDLTKWAKILDDIKRRRVAQTTFTSGVKVSTVFLGLNHGTVDKPLLFETWVEGKGALDDDMTRTPTWAEALDAHRTAVREIVGNGHKVKKNDEWGRPHVERRSQWDRLTDDRDDL